MSFNDECDSRHFSEAGAKSVFINRTLYVIQETVYATRMIKSIRGTATRQFVETGKSKFSGLDTDLADQRLGELDAARSLADFDRLKKIGLHKLTGNYRGLWAIRVNGPWRIMFRFEDGNAHDVEIIDYH